jgi:hypothetical protein
VIKLNDDRLLCPDCGEQFVHMDMVYVSAPAGGTGHDDHREEITVNAWTGQVVTHGDMPGPIGSIGVGDRHRVVLGGWCETCGSDFGIVFTQWEGETVLDVVRLTEHDSGRPVH